MCRALASNMGEQHAWLGQLWGLGFQCCMHWRTQAADWVWPACGSCHVSLSSRMEGSVMLCYTTPDIGVCGLKNSFEFKWWRCTLIRLVFMVQCDCGMGHRSLHGCMCHLILLHGHYVTFVSWYTWDVIVYVLGLRGSVEIAAVSVTNNTPECSQEAVFYCADHICAVIYWA